MPKTKEEYRERLDKLAFDLEKKGFNQGVYQGIILAERILERWYANHQLLQPFDPDQLREWSLAAIAELNTRITD